MKPMTNPKIRMTSVELIASETESQLRCAVLIMQQISTTINDSVMILINEFQ